MSSVIYNGIPLSYALTKVNSTGPVKDPSGSDQLFNEIHLSTTASLSVQQASGLPILPPATQSDVSVGGLLVRIRELLCQPRKSLWYSLDDGANGKTDTPILYLPDGRDDAGGVWPDTTAISVTLTTPEYLEIAWACVVRIRDCGTTQPSTSLSNRWDETISFDKTFKCTVKISGTCIISSRSNFNLDSARRNIIAPLCGAGFRRESSSYTMSRDALRCDYVFVDTQFNFSAPFPSVEMNINQAEEWKTMSPQLRKGIVVVTLVGIMGANMRTLKNIAMCIVKSRVFAAGGIVSGKVIGDVKLSTNESTEISSLTCQSTYLVTPPPQIRELTAVNNGEASW